MGKAIGGIEGALGFVKFMFLKTEILGPAKNGCKSTLF